MLQAIIRGIFHVMIGLVYQAYSIEGINALLLLMPAKLIAPTLRRYGATVGEEVEIHSPLLIHNANPQAGQHYAHLTIGSHCHLGRDILLDLRAPLVIEEYVTISMRCTLLTHTDPGLRPPNYQLPELPLKIAPIHIEPGAYLGAGSTILPGVTIGMRTIVGAGSLVRQDTSADMKIVGVPARPIDLTVR
ncbi:MAG: acyltransferase [Oscillochloridaceae bacterium umkhey_bin13]